MKIEGIEGEYAFKALIRNPGNYAWDLTPFYYLNIKDIEKDYPNVVETDVKWPVEVMENGAIYVPSKEELK